ncbi:ATP-binding protein [Paractinoplanes brasiliensis]|uniref:STAS domain-containing protein n=1 Tax=Paractinoplanes brasiliensis TaxID=52695 RepID=A0A4V3C8K5_9ACTN|nr:ATP-binding protein [Actinoplanes brasiliensis]TDO41968.1 hypothetical protein C8E87_5730 [Actinoplanes brasiliensis]
MRTTTQRDLESGITTVMVSGALTKATKTTIRSAIGKAAAECPAAVVVDLSGLSQSEPGEVLVLPVASHAAQQTWGVPVLLYAAEPCIRRELSAYRMFVALYDDRWQAMTAVRAYVPRWRRQHLAPVPASAAAARALTGEACLAWNLTALRDRARLITSELAANAIQHAATDFEVMVAHTRCYLRIAVQDGSRVLPHTIDHNPPTGMIVPPGSGRGLLIVDASSTHWGATRVPGGKIVWALMRTGG